MLWKQFGGAVDMLDIALVACPDALWREPVWPAPGDAAERTQFWYVAYHALFWLDVYLFGTEVGFAPPAPFELTEQEDGDGPLPSRMYTKEELRGYLASLREKLRVTIREMSDERAAQPVEFAWMEQGEVVTYAEVQLYGLRHFQGHAAELSLLLGQRGVPMDAWATRAKDDLT
jgi:hypothetical protein